MPSIVKFNIEKGQSDITVLMVSYLYDHLLITGQYCCSIDSQNIIVFVFYREYFGEKIGIYFAWLGMVISSFSCADQLPC